MTRKLPWGDQVYVIKIENNLATDSAKVYHVELPVEHLIEDPILCVYQIDCGQGDAALVHYPDDRWMMIDGGPAHNWSNSGKKYTRFSVLKNWVAAPGWRSAHRPCLAVPGQKSTPDELDPSCRGMNSNLHRADQAA